MSLAQEYEFFLRNASWYKHVGEDNAPELAYLLLGLNGETGEFSDNIKKVVRETGFTRKDWFDQLMERDLKKNILELGDILWYLTRIIDAFTNLTLDQVRTLNVLKLFVRMERMHRDGNLPIEMPMWPLSGTTFDEAVELWRDTFGVEDSP